MKQNEIDKIRRRFEEHVRRELVPMIRDSFFVMSIIPLDKDGVDVKFAVELGVAIMLDKPLIGVIRPGTKIPEKLARVVDRFIELDMSQPGAQQRMQEAFAVAMDELLPKKGTE